MSFVRPEATAALWRWREVLVGGAVLAVGAWWAVAAVGVLHWLGYLVAAAGAVLTVAGVQRGRFRTGQDGPGVVGVVEGQITYFGPLTGGTVALGELTGVALDPTGTPPHWILSQSGQPDLAIPLTASGADALFDAFASLPGIRTERMLAQMKQDGDSPVTIWQKSYPSLH